MLDLGHRYPVGDDRDPFRRMPRIFEAARKVFGGGMFRHDSVTRLGLEKQLGHRCRVVREQHGPCTQQRIDLCQRIVIDAIRHASTAPDKAQRIQYAKAALKRSVTDERAYDELKATRVSAPTDTLPMPPISLRQVPAA